MIATNYVRINYVNNLQFLQIESTAELRSFNHEQQLLELMETSGCDKRRLHLDALAKGLEVLGVKKLFLYFPEVCKPVLVSSGVIDGESVMNLLRPQPKEKDMNMNELRVWKYLLCFIDNATEEGIVRLRISISCHILIAIYMQI